MIFFFLTLYLPENYIDSALTTLNLQNNSLSFPKLEWVDTRMILPVVRDLINNPLYGEEYANVIINAINESELNIYNRMSEDIKCKSGKLKMEINNQEDLVTILEKAMKEREEAFQDLSDEEINILIGELPGRWESEEDSTDDWIQGVTIEEFMLDYDTAGINDSTIMDIFNKVDLQKLVLAGKLLLLISGEIDEYLMSIPEDSLPKTIHKDDIKIIIGGRGNNTYNGRYSIILDRGGNDFYKNCGRAIGYKNAVGLSLIFDMEGDDRYSSDIMFANSSGFLGCAVIMDKSGDDYYEAGHFSIASGYMGCGILVDKNGDDIYRGGIFSIGAANFGLGLLIDDSGDDYYSTMCYGEGFSSTYGYGILADKKGSDVYYSGGRYFHAPLQPESYQSLSQGFSIGVRPDWGGGIAFLYDGEGNDFYNADIYAQGTSYWCSAGFLVDEEGQDTYTATQYAQGAGIHLSYGFLRDRRGNDRYFSRYGPSQGEGHDFSCGILIDSSGNDWYTVSGGLGIGLYNSFGLFADISGDDIYDITEEFGIGDVNTGRDFKGLGIFLDLAGKDVYPQGRGADNSSWVNNEYGIGIDNRSGFIKESITQRKVPDFTVMDIEELFDTASEWGVGDNVKRVKKAREELAKRGKEALDFIFENKINTESSLEMRAIEYALRENRDSVIRYLNNYVSDRRKKVRRNVFRLIGDIKLEILSDSLLKYLKIEDNTRVLRSIIYAIGENEEDRAVDELINLLEGNETLCISSIKSLGKIKDTTALIPLLEKLNGSDVTIKSAIVKAVSNFDSLAFPFIRKRIDSDFSVELLIIGANAVTSKENEDYYLMKRILFKYLEDENWKRREFASRGLSIMGGDDVFNRFTMLSKSEPSRIVRSIMERFIIKNKK